MDGGLGNADRFLRPTYPSSSDGRHFGDAIRSDFVRRKNLSRNEKSDDPMDDENLRGVSWRCAAPRRFCLPPNESRNRTSSFIFTDDQGYGDIGCFGATGYQTPHLDQMAREGRKLTSFYVAQAVCSASRAALLTGCYSNRVGILGALGPRSRIGINPGRAIITRIAQGERLHDRCDRKMAPRRPTGISPHKAWV